MYIALTFEVFFSKISHSTLQRPFSIFRPTEETNLKVRELKSSLCLIRIIKCVITVLKSRMECLPRDMRYLDTIVWCVSSFIWREPPSRNKRSCDNIESEVTGS